MKNNALMFIQSAIDEKPIRVEFEIDFNGKKFPVMFDSVDILGTAAIQDALLLDYMAEYEKAGDVNKPPVLSIWQDELEDTLKRQAENWKQNKAKTNVEYTEEELAFFIDSSRKRLESDKPKNLAHQKVLRRRNFEIWPIVIPQMMKNPQTNEYYFPDKESQEQFSAIMRGRAEVFRILIDNYIALQNQISEVSEQVKN